MACRLINGALFCCLSVVAAVSAGQILYLERGRHAGLDRRGGALFSCRIRKPRNEAIAEILLSIKERKAE